MGGNFCFFIFAFVFNLHYYVPSSFASPINKGTEDTNFTIKYHVSVHIRHPGTYHHEYACGGTIIHDKYVLSAASCFIKADYTGITKNFNLRDSPTLVTAGTNKRYEGGFDKDVIRIYVPNIYQSHPSLKANLAILMLRQSLQVERDPTHVQIVHVDQLTSRKGLYCGFGYYKRKKNENREYEVVPELSNTNRCSYVNIQSTHEGTINALPENVKTTPCPGDEGAGLIQDHKIVGILTGDLDNCLEKNEQIEFTYIWPLMHYIQSAMNLRDAHSDLHVIMYDSS